MRKPPRKLLKRPSLRGRRRGLLRRRQRPPLSRMLRQLPNLVRLIYRLFTDARVSVFDRALFATVVAYVLAPFDLLPDWLGMFGLTDDFYLVGLSLSRLLHSAGPDVLLEHWRGSPKVLGYIIESIEDVGSRLPKAVRTILQKMTG
jgi:uncharacterized membrane protein YkvA (DUF1232 family)